MSDARNVYIIIFVMLLLPIVFYMLRRRFRTKDTKKKARCLVYMAVMIVAAGGLCYGLYAYTINVDLTGRRHLQKIQAAQKRALSAARRPNDTHDLGFINLSIDAL